MLTSSEPEWGKGELVAVDQHTGQDRVDSLRRRGYWEMARLHNQSRPDLVYVWMMPPN
jgi:hypothetical protein